MIALIVPAGVEVADATGPLPGEAAIMARYLEKFAVANVLIPMPGDVPADVYGKLPRKNFIDGHVWDKLRRLGLTPSAPAADATFHRRAFLDVIGRLRTKVSAVVVRHGLPQDVELTIGAAFSAVPPDAAEELLREADADMRRRRTLV